MVVSKFGISEIPGGPDFQGMWMLVSGRVTQSIHWEIVQSEKQTDCSISLFTLRSCAFKTIIAKKEWTLTIVHMMNYIYYSCCFTCQIQTSRIVSFSNGFLHKHTPNHYDLFGEQLTWQTSKHFHNAAEVLWYRTNDHPEKVVLYSIHRDASLSGSVKQTDLICMFHCKGKTKKKNTSINWIMVSWTFSKITSPITLLPHVSFLPNLPTPVPWKVVESDPDVGQPPPRPTKTSSLPQRPVPKKRWIRRVTSRIWRVVNLDFI